MSELAPGSEMVGRSGKLACRGDPDTAATNENVEVSPWSTQQGLLESNPDVKQLGVLHLLQRHPDWSPTEPDSPQSPGDTGLASQRSGGEVEESGPDTQDPATSHNTSVVPEDSGCTKRKRDSAELHDSDEGGDGWCDGVISEDKRTVETRQRRKVCKGDLIDL